jgi:DNA polymerase kappa
MLAKVCSDKNKPNGQYRILPERDKIMEFITTLPTRKVISGE